MKALNIFLATLLVAVLAACSSTTDKKEIVESKIFDYKAPPVKVKPLEVPPDLTSYVGDDRFGIPGDGESGMTYLEYSQGGFKRKNNGVLPIVKKISLQRKDNLRWILVNDKAENIWPIVKEFWKENGLEIKIDNPQVGVIETEWAENRAKTPKEGLHKYLFDNMPSSGERDQYHTRLERTKDGESTEIYITHYGMQEVIEKSDQGYRWLPRPNDPELEATMMQLLISKLSGGSGVLDNAKKKSADETAVKVSAPTLNTLADGSQSITLAEPFDKSWRKVGLALDQAGIKLADKDRSKGLYYLSSGKDGAKAKLGVDNIVRMQVIVKEVGTGCEVTVNNGAAVTNADTQKVIDALFKSLGNI
jgi:outer membrane protein assembly factor BamC